MTAVLNDRPSVEFPQPVVLTAAEYDALPPNSRVELVDGAVQVITPATRRHQIVVQRIRAALEAVCPEDLCVVWEQEVRLADDHRRNPDVMVVRAAADDLDIYSYDPADVVRGDRAPIVVHAFRLGESGRYLESGLFKEGDLVAPPGLMWAAIAVADLAP